MNSDFLNLVIPIASLYIAVMSIVFMFFALRRERRRASDRYAPEATRWIENAATLKTLGWTDAAVILVFVGLEQTLRGIAKQRMIAEAEIPLSHLSHKLVDEGVLDKQDVDIMIKIAETRNYLVHGQGEKIAKEDIEFAYENSVKIAERLLMTKLSSPKKTSGQLS